MYSYGSCGNFFFTAYSLWRASLSHSGSEGEKKKEAYADWMEVAAWPVRY